MMRFTLIVILFVSVASIELESELREYSCSRKSPRHSKADCQLQFGNDELSAINDNGCFMHFDSKKNEAIELCPLQCQQFNKAEILKTFDTKCAPGINVGVERRQSDWFMWRSEECRVNNLNIQFKCSIVPVMLEAEEPQMEEEVVTNIQNSISDDLENSSSIEDITSLIIEATTSTPTTPEVDLDADLPDKVDALLGFMFPTYRKKSI